MNKPVIAIVGRPNVGKSTLFNKLIGQRVSIVDDTPGVTRDRIYGEVEWCGKTAMVIDTGGIEPKSDDVILEQMRRQAELAIDTANAIILVTDCKSGMVATDADVAQMLQKSGKPIVVCVNKCDTVGEPDMAFYEFYNLGLGDPVQVSAVHGHGTGDLLDAVYEHLTFSDEEEEGEDAVNVAVIGKPNAGKSSLINKITSSERCIVSDIAGTTRDSIDTLIENSYGRFNFTDTAGLRRQSRIYDDIEKYSILRAKMAIERSDVCVIMIEPSRTPRSRDLLTRRARRVFSLSTSGTPSRRTTRPCPSSKRNWTRILPLCPTLLRFLSPQRRDSVSTGCLRRSSRQTRTPACESARVCSTSFSLRRRRAYSRRPTRARDSRFII